MVLAYLFFGFRYDKFRLNFDDDFKGINLKKVLILTFFMSRENY